MIYFNIVCFVANILACVVNRKDGTSRFYEILCFCLGANFVILLEGLAKIH